MNNRRPIDPSKETMLRNITFTYVHALLHALWKEHGVVMSSITVSATEKGIAINFKGDEIRTIGGEGVPPAMQEMGVSDLYKAIYGKEEEAQP